MKRTMKNVTEGYHIELFQEEIDSLLNNNEICLFEDEDKQIKIFISLHMTSCRMCGINESACNRWKSGTDLCDGCLEARTN